MLRGQGSLKELLGQNVVSASYARKKRLKAAADASAAAAAEPAAKRRAGPASSKSAPAGTEAAADAAARLFAKAQRNATKPDPQASDLTTVRPDAADAATPRHVDGDGLPETVRTDSGRSGSVALATDRRPASERSRAGAGGSTPICCPICSRALSESSGAINSHIGAVAQCCHIHLPMRLATCLMHNETSLSMSWLSWQQRPRACCRPLPGKISISQARQAAHSHGAVRLRQRSSGKALPGYAERQCSAAAGGPAQHQRTT